MCASDIITQWLSSIPETHMVDGENQLLTTDTVYHRTLVYTHIRVYIQYVSVCVCPLK